MRLFTTALIACICTACSATFWGGQPAKPFQNNSQLVASSHDAVSKLLAKIPVDHPLDPKLPIIVASLVSIDDLASSRLGRMVSEQLIKNRSLKHVFLPPGDNPGISRTWTRLGSVGDSRFDR